MNKGQKYVVRCHSKVKGLGSNTFLPGTYITYEAVPTNDLNKAKIYTHLGDEFQFDDSVDDVSMLSDFFSPVPVRLVVEILEP